MSTTESSRTKTAEAAPHREWRLDTDGGSMRPRSTLDVLVNLNEKVSTGDVGEYQPVPLGFTPHGQDHRHRPARG